MDGGAIVALSTMAGEDHMSSQTATGASATARNVGKGSDDLQPRRPVARSIADDRGGPVYACGEHQKPLHREIVGDASFDKPTYLRPRALRFV